MIRNKFIKKLRKKYQKGGLLAKGNLREPYLALQGKTISTDTETRYGAGANLSVPLLESMRRGADATGLRGDMNFVGTDSGPMSFSNRDRAYNAALGLRGYHNRFLDRSNTLSLNTNIGAGLGTGDEDSDNTMNPYGDINVSLLKASRSNPGLAVGPAISYGTEGSSNPGLNLGLAGRAGRFSGNVGYDVTNNAVKAGASYNFQTGGVKYNTMDKIQDSLTLAGMAPKLGIIPDAVNTGISGIRAAYNYATGDTARAKSQMVDLGKNALSMVPAYGQTVAATKLGDRGLKVIKGIDKAKKLKKGKAAYNLATANPVQSTTPAVTPIARNYTNINAGSGTGPLASKLNTAAPATFNLAPSIMQMGGMYDQPQMMREGGTKLPGGMMKPIPGSDAVEFKGRSHEQGGIMVDNQTEVEGGETMDKVNMAKKGGKRDYFFSSFLKKGGKSFADMHKDILRKGGDQEEINMLAKMQETAAGRNPKKVAKLGGVVEYKHGGVHKYETGGAQKKYDEHESNKPTFDLSPPSPVRDLKKNANKIEEMQYKAKIAEYEKQVAEYNKAKEAYEAEVVKWEAKEGELSDAVEQEQMLQEEDKRVAQEKAAEEERIAQEEEKIKQEKADLSKRATNLKKKANELGISIEDYVGSGGGVLPSKIDALETAVTAAETELKTKADELGIEYDEKTKLDKLIYNVQEASYDYQGGMEGDRLPGGKGVPNTQGEDEALAKKLGISAAYLKDPELRNKLMSEDFTMENWMATLDQELLEQAGITNSSDWNDKSKVKSYQKGLIEKYDYDTGNKGLVGEKIFRSAPDAIETSIQQKSIPEVTVTDTYPNNSMPRLQPVPGAITMDGQPILPGETPSYTTPTIREGEELTTIPRMQPELLTTNLNEIPLPSGPTPPYSTPEDIPETDPYTPYDAKVPWQAYAGMGAGLIPAAYAMFHKQPPAEQAGYTQGFTEPVIAQRGKAPKLERYDYNQDIANVGSEVRGMNKYIETSGGGPANMVNKMMAFKKGNDAKMKIRAAETRANIGVQNTEAQLEQQMNLDNMKRAQSASIFNAQMSRAETARMDQVDEANTQRRQKRIDDMEYMKYQGMSQLGQSLQQGFGDILDYKADIAKAAAIGSASGNVYKDSVLYQQGWRYNPDTGQLEPPKQGFKFGGLKMLQKYKK